MGLAGLAGCAPLSPPPPPRLEGPAVAARFGARLAERRSRAAVAEGDYAVWVHRAEGKDPPGVSVRVRLVAPDAFRLRVDALLGTAVDAAARRDTLVLDAPALGLSAITDAGDDRSARQDVGNWVWRTLSASWSPPAAAWSEGAERDTAWNVRWIEAGDTLELEVPSTGLPRAARVRAGGGQPFELEYPRWAAWNDVMWPSRVVVSDGGGRVRVTLQPQSLSLRPRDAAGLRALRRPRGAVRVSRSRLLAWLERLALEAGADTTRMEGE